MSSLSFTALPSYENQKKYLYTLKNEYPFISVGSCGKSHAGREIFCFSVGRGNKKILYTAAYHAQEWLTALILLRFAQDICFCIKKRRDIFHINIAGALEKTQLVFVPCVNPDGVEVALNGPQSTPQFYNTLMDITNGDFSSFNANAAGVDINHNFNAGWDILQELEKNSGITGPAPRRYGGIMPESEPETRAVTSLCRQKIFKHAIALHSQGEEIYWRYGDTNPDDSETMAKIFAAASGYSLVNNEGLASHGGFKDWFISEFNRPAFTFEMGKGKNPLPLSDLEPIYEKTQLMLVQSAIM